MLTLNQPSRTKATYKFFIIYASSLIGVLLLSYFLFSTPSKILKGQLKKYSDVKVQHDALLGRTDYITTHLVDLITFEKIGETSSDSGIDSLIADYHQKIASTVDSIRRDSANNAFSLLQDELKGYLTAYKAILHSPLKKMSPIGTLSPPLKPIVKPPVEDKTPATVQEELQTRLQTALQQNQLAIQQNTEYKEQVRRLNEQLARQSRQTPTNQPDPALTRIERENQDLQVQVNSKIADITRLKARISELESSKQPKQGGSSASTAAAEKANAVLEAIDQLITSGLRAGGSPSKKMGEEAKTIVQQYKRDYTGKTPYNNLLSNINKFANHVE